ncbi:hypothetical protein PX118_07210 [Enterobacter cloacae]|uniref:hypothetical protein n=1 Tax=Enterobacter cloacae TaxID=550 RepID=UPI00111FB821|nr:hypothetical protein [Enterobacter cloacae]MCI1184382.1 hypothetical protein [Enterobacter cloacae]MCK6747910.1 hypothetical protein [Enterobacter cloacae]MCT9037612.1 hypothetical protein [Enterobacter cloacae]HDC4773199.1 hypothetical protein [Enterobacter cloacae]
MNSEQPVSLSELKFRLLELNYNADIPFSVIEKKDKLIASWKIVDAKWIELFGIGGLKKQYELTLRFDEEKSLVSYREKSIDIETEINAERCGFKKEVRWGSRKEFSFGKSYGLKTNGTIGEQYSYKFSTADIKNPVFGIVEQSGWILKKSLVDKYGTRLVWLIIVAVMLLVAVYYLI